MGADISLHSYAFSDSTLIWEYKVSFQLKKNVDIKFSAHDAFLE
jgi:hypothetical protein